MKKYLHTFKNVSLAVCATLLAGSAGAAAVRWEFHDQALNSLPTHTFTEYSIAGTGLQSGVSLTMSAYSTGTGSSAATRLNTTWVNAVFNNQYSSGLGITNNVQGAGSPEANNTAPEHGIDSISATDIVVLDAGYGKKMDWTSFVVGWSSENGISNQADLQAWTSGTQTANVNFNNVCFSGCTGATATLASLGFNTTNTYNNVIAGNTVNFDGNPTPVLTPSRYLILSGNIGQIDDAFKFKAVNAQTVPEPASMALIGLGLIGLGYARRRRPA